MPTGLDKQHAMLMLHTDRSLSPAAKSVGGTLVDHFNLETQLCFPSMELMAAELLFDVRTIKRATKALKQAGWISWQRQGRSNHYTINWKHSAALFAEREQRIADFRRYRKQNPIGDNPVTLSKSDPPVKTAIGDNLGPIGDSGVTCIGDIPVTLTLESNKRSRSRECAPASFENEIQEEANPSDSERVGESPIAQQGTEPSAGIERTPRKLTKHEIAIRRWRADLMEHGHKPDGSRVDPDALPAELVEQVTEAELQRKGAGLTVLLDHLEAGAAA